MQILVDADACPVVIRDILCKAAHKRGISLVFFANQPFSIPQSLFINFHQVAQGFDMADDEIIQRACEGDLIITADIPLASEIIKLGARVLTPRGEQYTSENIGQRLQMRDFMETMRASGGHSRGSRPLSRIDRKHFADQLDRLLTRLIRKTT